MERSTRHQVHPARQRPASRPRPRLRRVSLLVRLVDSTSPVTYPLFWVRTQLVALGNLKTLFALLSPHSSRDTERPSTMSRIRYIVVNRLIECWKCHVM